MGNSRILKVGLVLQSLVIILLFVALNRNAQGAPGTVFGAPIFFTGYIPTGVSFVGKPMANGEVDMTVRLCVDTLPNGKKVCDIRGKKFSFSAK